MHGKRHLPLGQTENARPLQFGITPDQSQGFSGPSAPNGVSTQSSLRPIDDFRSDVSAAFLENQYVPITQLVPLYSVQSILRLSSLYTCTMDQNLSLAQTPVVIM